MANERESLIEFPCRFPIKAMGKADAEFDTLVVGIIRKHVPDMADFTVSTRASKSGRFVAVTVTINAQSMEQLDNIYLELTANEKILMAL